MHLSPSFSQLIKSGVDVHVKKFKGHHQQQKQQQQDEMKRKYQNNYVKTL